MTDYILIIFLSSVLGQVWLMLLQPYMLFDFVGPWIDRIKNEKINHMLKCSVCMSGQFALWIYLPYSVSRGTYDPFDHVCIIACAIWLTAMTNKILRQ